MEKEFETRLAAMAGAGPAAMPPPPIKPESARRDVSNLLRELQTNLQHECRQIEASPISFDDIGTRVLDGQYACYDDVLSALEDIFESDDNTNSRAVAAVDKVRRWLAKSATRKGLGPSTLIVDATIKRPAAPLEVQQQTTYSVGTRLQVLLHPVLFCGRPNFRFALALTGNAWAYASSIIAAALGRAGGAASEAQN
jgi:hypothetical protein